jgi:hypothetical protein
MLSKRKEVVFDATNEEHRMLYSKFLKKRTWDDTPIKFRAPHFGITLGYIERTMLEYYTKKEFGSK